MVFSLFYTGYMARACGLAFCAMQDLTAVCGLGAAQYLFNALSENNCSEQASRMQAMENSTKNASEMLEKLTLSYNRSAHLIHTLCGRAVCMGHVSMPAGTPHVLSVQPANCMMHFCMPTPHETCLHVCLCLEQTSTVLGLLQDTASSHHHRADRNHLWSGSLGRLRYVIFC